MLVAGDKLYVSNLAAISFVLPTARIRVLAKNSISETTTPRPLRRATATAFWRTHQHLYCIGSALIWIFRRHAGLILLVPQRIQHLPDLFDPPGESASRFTSTLFDRHHLNRLCLALVKRASSRELLKADRLRDR